MNYDQREKDDDLINLLVTFITLLMIVFGVPVTAIYLQLQQEVNCTDLQMAVEIAKNCPKIAKKLDQCLDDGKLSRIEFYRILTIHNERREIEHKKEILDELQQWKNENKEKETRYNIQLAQ